MRTNDLIGAIIIAIFGAADATIVYWTTEGGCIPCAIALAALAIYTLRLFARQALQEIRS